MVKGNITKAVKISMILSILLGISQLGAATDVSRNDFFSGKFTDNNLTITSTKLGTTAGAGVDTLNFKNYNALNIRISDKTLYKRNTQR